VSPRITNVVLALLLSGSALNMLAGLRRLRDEPRLRSAAWSGPYTPPSDPRTPPPDEAPGSAAAAIREHVPASEVVTLVLFDHDLLYNTDCATWGNYRLRWEAYPRHFQVYIDSPARRDDPDFGPALSSLPPTGYLLFFRISQVPELPHGIPLRIIARDPHWILAEAPPR
jgi:hypothetical protein